MTRNGFSNFTNSNGFNFIFYVMISRKVRRQTLSNISKKSRPTGNRLARKLRLSLRRSWTQGETLRGIKQTNNKVSNLFLTNHFEALFLKKEENHLKSWLALELNLQVHQASTEKKKIVRIKWKILKMKQKRKIPLLKWSLLFFDQSH